MSGHGSAHARWCRAANLAACLLMTSAALGAIAPPRAAARCAGPLLAVEQGGASLAPRRVGEGDRERLLYDVTRDQPLRLHGSNLTFGCRDTLSTTGGGCGAPTPDPVEPIVPMRNVHAVLTQGGRTWTIGRVDDIRPDLTAQLEVHLPAAVRTGSAVLALVERPTNHGARLDLVLR